MSTPHKNLQNKIEEKRLQMAIIASTKGIISRETLKVSKELDKLIMLSMKCKHLRLP